MAKRAIVRPPGKSYPKCISSHPRIGSLRFELALEQHQAYVRTLEELGLDIITIPPEDDLPDACFVEDTAVVFKNKALITRPKFDVRQEETNTIADILGSYLHIEYTLQPATLEGGDVIHLENMLISGITQRTNKEGVKSLETILDTAVHSVKDEKIVHLKSYITYLGNENYIMTEKYSNNPIFANAHCMIVSNEEAYASNTLTVNGMVLLPKGYPKTKDMLKDNGFDVLTLDMSEFAKCEGALTCLSIIF